MKKKKKLTHGKAGKAKPRKHSKPAAKSKSKSKRPAKRPAKGRAPAAVSTAAPTAAPASVSVRRRDLTDGERAKVFRLNVVSVRLTDAQLADLDALASKAGTNHSTVVRSLIATATASLPGRKKTA